jgi:hypothetical protein
MAKELPYFKFHVSEWINGNITLEDFYVQGVFANICAYYWFRSGELTLTEIKRRLSKAKPTAFEALIRSGIISVENDVLSIKFLDEQLADRVDTSKENSKNGKLGGRPKKATALISESEDKAKKSQLEKIREEQEKIREEEPLEIIKQVSRFISITYKKRYDRDVGGPTGQDIEDMVKFLLKSMDQKTLMDQARNHVLYTGLSKLILPSRLETIQAALMDTDWITKFKESQDNEKLQNGISNEQARRGTRVTGSDIPPAYLGKLDN